MPSESANGNITEKGHGCGNKDGNGDGDRDGDGLGDKVKANCCDNKLLLNEA